MMSDTSYSRSASPASIGYEQEEDEVEDSLMVEDEPGPSSSHLLPPSTSMPKGVAPIRKTYNSSLDTSKWTVCVHLLPEARSPRNPTPSPPPAARERSVFSDLVVCKRLCRRCLRSVCAKLMWKTSTGDFGSQMCCLAQSII
ncbi:hypothetical protein BD309DRAFT_1045900 [Dichomitus squalens]|nr:hypothetical protein BD309DRAFT_1045900 [Dichomitus squalens]